MAYIQERKGRFTITINNGQQALSKTFGTKEEVIIWRALQKFALKRGDLTFNLTKDKFADIATVGHSGLLWWGIFFAFNYLPVYNPVTDVSAN